MPQDAPWEYDAPVTKMQDAPWERDTPVSSPLPDYLRKDDGLSDIVSDLPGGGWNPPPTGPRHPMAQFGEGLVRGAGNVVRGAVNLFTPPHLRAFGGPMPADRIEEMLPEPPSTSVGKMGQFMGGVTATLPLSLVGGPGLGAASVPGRIGAEAVRGATLGAMNAPDNPMGGALLGAPLGAAGQGVAESLRALGPAAIAAMRRLYSVPEAMNTAAPRGMPGVTANQVAEQMLDTGAMTPGQLTGRTADAYTQAGGDIMAAVNASSAKIPADAILPPQQRQQLMFSTLGQNVPQEVIDFLANGSAKVYTPAEAQALKQVFSQMGGAAPAEAGQFAREAAGRAGGALGQAIPEYLDLMRASQRAQAALTAANQGANPIAARAAGIGAGAAVGSVAPYPVGPVVGALMGGTRGVGETALLSGLQGMRYGSQFADLPWAAAPEAALNPLAQFFEE